MTIAFSRNPTPFLQRKGKVPTDLQPAPRFSPMSLLVHQYPTGFTTCKGELAEGDPPPDRVVMKEWPPT